MSNRKVILVSGGSRGLGQAIVRDLLEAGHIVATFSRSESSFIQTTIERDPEHHSFYWAPIDGTDFARLSRFALQVTRQYGRIDVLINNAATGVEGILTTMSDDQIHQGIALNLESAIYLTRACLKTMLIQQSGSIISITSVNGLRGHTGVSVYSATKAGLEGMTRSLAREVGAAGIRVNTIAPGYFESDMTTTFTDAQRALITRRTPLQRLGTVEDLVGVVRFLISPEAAFITGQTLVVDGGISC